MDDFCSTRDTLAVGAGERLYDWRIHSCFACHRNRCGADQNHSGTQTVLTVGIREGRAGTKEVRTRKDFFWLWRGCENKKIH